MAEIERIQQEIRRFCSDRDWDKYHTPKDLAIGLVTEASEFVEHFRFRSDSDCVSLLSDPIAREQIEDELIDSLFFILRFADKYQVDIDKAFDRKMLKNAKKYPLLAVEKSDGEIRA